MVSGLWSLVNGKPMNQRVLNVILVMQALFIAALFYAGYASREYRKVGYLELTHRVTSGQATNEDFERLASMLPEVTDKSVVRSLFGLPMARAGRVEIKDAPAVDGDIWLYYPLQKSVDQKGADGSLPMASLDVPDVEKMSGPVQCFIFIFDSRGRATWRRADVGHPLSYPPVSPPKK